MENVVIRKTFKMLVVTTIAVAVLMVFGYGWVMATTIIWERHGDLALMYWLSGCAFVTLILVVLIWKYI
jgi:hypothetical protein